MHVSCVYLREKKKKTETKIPILMEVRSTRAFLYTYVLMYALVCMSACKRFVVFFEMCFIQYVICFNSLACRANVIRIYVRLFGLLHEPFHCRNFSNMLQKLAQRLYFHLTLKKTRKMKPFSHCEHVAYGKFIRNCSNFDKQIYDVF